jgi:hypothetical protein
MQNDMCNTGFLYRSYNSLIITLPKAMPIVIILGDETDIAEPLLEPGTGRKCLEASFCVSDDS